MWNILQLSLFEAFKSYMPPFEAKGHLVPISIWNKNKHMMNDCRKKKYFTNFFLLQEFHSWCFHLAWTLKICIFHPECFCPTKPATQKVCPFSAPSTPSSFIEYTDIGRFYNHCKKNYVKVQCIKMAYKEKTTTETNLSSPFYCRTYFLSCSYRV